MSKVHEQRRSQRFQLRLPIEVIRAGNRGLSQQGETRNLSSGGILFISHEIKLEVGQPIEYVVSLPAPQHCLAKIHIRCLGKVVRLENGDATAATLERYEFVRN